MRATFPLALALAALSLSLGARPAQADSSWDTVFTRAFVSSHHRGPAKSVAVVCPEATAEARAATRSLRSAYRTIAKQVVEPDRLPDVRGMSDHEIARRLAGTAQHIAIVRITHEDGTRRALVAIYAQDGRMVTVYSASPSGDRVASTPPGTRRKPARVEDAAAEYRSRYISFNDRETTTGERVLGSLAFQGLQQEPLAGARFYRALGRDDLAEQYRKRRTIRTALGVTSVGLLGVALATGVVWPCDEEFEVDGCSGNRQALALGSTLLGVTSAAVALLISPHPVSAKKRRILVDLHNRRLRDQLGLQAEPVSMRGVQPHISVGAVGGTGVQLGMSGRF